MSEKHTASAMLFIRAHTEMHAGSGESSGVIDQAIQREVHTAWPTIRATGLKGVLRDACQSGEWKETLFGPRSILESGAGYAGALTITDARVLAFPVQSAKGVFAWVTCGEVFQRLCRDFALLGWNDNDDALSISEIDENQAYASEAGVKALALPWPGGTENMITLRDVSIKANVDKKIGHLAKTLATLSGNVIDHERLNERLVVTDKNTFTHFCRTGTAVVSRNKLCDKTKTVVGNALFMIEYLPAETLMYSVLIADKQRNPKLNGNIPTPYELIESVKATILDNRFMQLGADETTGHGWCEMGVIQGDGRS